MAMALATATIGAGAGLGNDLEYSQFDFDAVAYIQGAATPAEKWDRVKRIERIQSYACWSAPGGGYGDYGRDWERAVARDRAALEAKAQSEQDAKDEAYNRDLEALSQSLAKFVAATTTVLAVNGIGAPAETPNPSPARRPARRSLAHVDATAIALGI